MKVHNDYTREASSGRGIDRHLMGLRLVMKEEELSPLFEDELYGLSQEWLLSTSGLSAGDRFIGTGYAVLLSVWATTDNSVALEVRIWMDTGSIVSLPVNSSAILMMFIDLAGANILKFGIESKRSSRLTSTDRFKQYLTGALLEMRDVCLTAIEEENRTIQSREEQARL